MECDTSQPPPSMCTIINYVLCPQKQRESSRPERPSDLATMTTAAPPPAFRSAPEPVHVTGAPVQAGLGGGAAAAAPETLGFGPVTSSAMFFPGLAPFGQHEFGR